MRGLASLGTKLFDLAEAEFRKSIDHPTAETVSANIAFGHLGVGRALALSRVTWLAVDTLIQ